MKEAMWGVGIVMLGIFGIFLISLFGNITVTNQQDYTAMKNTVEAAMHDAVDVARFRTGFCVCTNNEKEQYKYVFKSSDEYEIADLINGECVPKDGSVMKNCNAIEGEYSIDKEIFAESLVRRFAESIKGNSDYLIEIDDVIEYPPKVSVTVRSTNSYEVGGGDYNIYNHIDSILEMNSKNDKEPCSGDLDHNEITGDYHDSYGNYCGHYLKCEKYDCKVEDDKKICRDEKGVICSEKVVYKKCVNIVRTETVRNCTITYDERNAECSKDCSRERKTPTPTTPTKDDDDDKDDFPISYSNNNSESKVGENKEEKVGSGTCFLAGTPVITKNGFKSIDKMLVGDFVLTYNEGKNINEYKRVKNVYIIKDVDEELYTVKTNDTVFSLTGHHRVYIFRGGKYQYIRAEDLNAGDVVKYSNGEYHEITNISHKHINDTVYNLEIEGNHNFFVSENGILVHNMRGLQILLGVGGLANQAQDMK